MAATDKSVAEIARNVGFPDQNYFTRLFARITGASPRRYRARKDGKRPAVFTHGVK